MSRAASLGFFRLVNRRRILRGRLLRRIVLIVPPIEVVAVKRGRMRTVKISTSCRIGVIHRRCGSLVLCYTLGISWNGFDARFLSRCGRVVVLLGSIANVAVIVISIMAMGRRWGRSIPPFSVMSAVASIVRRQRRLLAIVVRR